MKKFLIMLGLVCVVLTGAFADEETEPNVDAQNDAVVADATTDEVVADASGENVADAATDEVVADTNGENVADAATDEVVADASGENVADAATDEVVADANGENVAGENNNEEADLGATVAVVADTAVDAATGVAEAELNELIAAFPNGTWIDEKYNAAWVFADDGTLTVQNAKNGKVHFTFSLNKINSYSVTPTDDGVAVSFVCGETKRQYTFTKSNADDYKMTLQIKCGWIKDGYTAEMFKKQNTGVNKN